MVESAVRRVDAARAELKTGILLTLATPFRRQRARARSINEGDPIGAEKEPDAEVAAPPGLQPLDERNRLGQHHAGRHLPRDGARIDATRPVMKQILLLLMMLAAATLLFA